MRAGALDRVLEIWRDVEIGRDPDYNTPIIEFQNVRTVRAQRLAMSEDERVDADQRYASRVVTFRTRFLTDLRETDELRCEGVAYDVRGVRELGRRDGLEIKAETKELNHGG